MAVLGALVLVVYGFVPTAQPVGNFGRVFAVYGGFFIILSYLWGWAVDGDRPDKGEVVSLIAADEVDEAGECERRCRVMSSRRG